MIFQKSLLAVTFLALASASPISLSERASALCPSYTLVSTRGTGEAQGSSAGFRTMISQTLSAVPGGKEYDTVYPAGADQNSDSGTADIVRKVQSADTKCYILLGYSQGAAATVEAMKKLSGAAMDSVKGVVMVGDPEHKSGLACNVDSQGGSSTKDANGIEVYKGGVPDAWISRTLDICAFGDGVCDSSTGYGVTFEHLTYGSDSTVQSMGAKFMEKALQG